MTLPFFHLPACKMLSIEEMVKKEADGDKCIYKRANAAAFDYCYICDGFNYNCESYQLQMSAKEDAAYLSENDSD